MNGERLLLIWTSVALGGAVVLCQKRVCFCGCNLLSQWEVRVAGVEELAPLTWLFMELSALR